VIKLTDKGLYCEAGNFFIDPWKPVKKAIITHAHADHSRPGHGAYLAHYLSEPAMRLRLGADINFRGLAYGETLRLGQVKVSLHPAGHILGSSQIRIQGNAGIWVVSGDYKTQSDGICAPFEPVKCDYFITECTFGLPVFHWPEQDLVISEIMHWWKDAAAQGRVAIIAAYSLGKAQRIINNLSNPPGKIFVHGAIDKMNQALHNSGMPMQPTILVEDSQKFDDWRGGLVICPPAALGSVWTKKFRNATTGIASGWMQLRGTRRRKAVDRGFILSDHADWNGLNEAIAATGASHIYTTHGYKSTFSKWLQHQGYDAHVLDTQFGEVEED
jgi:putative mRNA 3-end processing factor